MPALATALLTVALAEPVATPPDPPDPSQHRWRLHGEITPLQLRFSTQPGGKSNTLSMSIPSTMAIGFGRALGRYVMIGARLSGGLERHATDVMAFSERTVSRRVSGGGSLVPYVEVRPLPDRRVQPFGLVEGGVGLWGMRHRTLRGLRSEPHRSLHVEPMVGGRVGLHAFVLPRLSIDADLGLRREWSFAWRASPAMSPDDVDSPPRVLRVSGTLGLSGWW